MAAQISINQLPPAGAITGAELVPVVQNGQTVQTTTGAISGSPSQTQSFLTVNQEPTLVNSRYLAVSTGLGLTNGGAGSFLRISLNGASGSLEAAGNGLVVKDSSSSVVARQIAVNGAGLSITDPSGVAGNPTLALSGLAAAFANLGGSGLAYVNAGTTAGLRLLTGTSNQITVTDGNGVAGNPTFALASNPVIPGTGAMTIPIGTSAQQPGGSDGQFRFNSDTGTFDGYAAGSWRTFSLSGGVTTFSAGSTGLTPAVPTSGSVTLAGTLNTSNGGTGLGGASPFTQYGILYASSANALTTGTALTFDGTNLGVGNNAFAWDTAAFNNAIDLSVYGAIYSTSSVAGVTGNVYYDGSAWHIKTLGPSTRYDQTAGSHVFYAAPTPVGLGNTTPTFVEILRLNTTGITLDGGTANGVLYLNGSKVATSGSALTFDGTNLGIGTSSPGARLDVVATASRAGLFRTNQAFSGIEFNDSGTSANPGVYSNGNSLTVWTGGAQRITLDSSGNLGVGVTPSAWSQGRAIELLAPGMGLFNAGSLGGPSLIYLTSNAYVNSGFKYGVNGEASSYLQWLGAHIWSTAPSGTAGNTITFSQVMTLDASGNLGIGTSSPAQKLHVRQDQAAYTWGRVDNQSSSASAYSGWMLGAFGNSWGIAIGSSAANSNALTFVLDAGGTNAEKMRLDSSGNLGLGVTPSAWNSGFKALQVGQTGSIGNNGQTVRYGNNFYYDAGGSFRYIASSYAMMMQLDAGSGGIQFYTAPSGTAGNAITFTQAMTLDASGNLGIGTSSPSSFSGYTTVSINNATNGAILNLLVNGTETARLQAYGGIFNVAAKGAATNLTFETNGNERMRLDSSGNLGLGVTPSAWSTGKAVEVGNVGSALYGYAAGYTLLTAGAYFNSGWKYANSTTKPTYYSQGDGLHYWYTAPSGTAGNAISFTQAMTLDASGNLGIGTSSPGAKLNIVGTTAGIGYLAGIVLSDNATTTVSLGLQTPGGSDFPFVYGNSGLGFGTNSTERMRLDSSGNLGLGVTPSAWGTAVVKSIQVGNGAGFGGNTTSGTPDAYMTSNCYYDGSNWRYITTDAAMTFDLRTNTASNVAAVWNIAPGGTAGDAITFTQAMTLDASGNLLLNTTSSPAYGSKLRVQGGIESFATQFNVASGTSTQFELVNRSASSGFDFYVNSGGTLAARITSGGALLVGATSVSGSETLRVYNSTNSRVTIDQASNGLILGADNSGPFLDTSGSNRLAFFIAGTERARITSGGYFKASNDGTYQNSTGSSHEFYQTANSVALDIKATNASYDQSVCFLRTDRAANSAFQFLFCNANGVGQFYVRGDGTIYAQNTTVQSISDVRVKENIRNSSDGLNVINAIRPVRFDFKPGFGNDRKNQLGFIAQEIETVFPDAVENISLSDEKDEPYKSVGPGALIPVLVKAIQEQQALITSLTARVALLEGN